MGLLDKKYYNTVFDIGSCIYIIIGKILFFIFNQYILDINLKYLWKIKLNEKS